VTRVKIINTASSKEMKDDDLYTLLQLEDSGPHVLQAVIRKAYCKRALELHPDKHGGDPIIGEEFMKLQKAYNILTNEEARASYDKLYEARKERDKKQRRVV
jgi:DnaJ family protein C protein 17